MKRLLPILLLALAACDKDPSGSTERLEIGDVLTINVNADSVCSAPINRQARVVALSEHAAVVADISNPANGFTESEYQQFADEFDAVAWPVGTTNFGTPSDVDGNGRILLVFTSAVNELTPRNAGYVVGGFFYGRDLFPKKDTDEAQACPASNQRELFYLLAPDPNGAINGNARTKAYVRTSTFGTLSHEFEHLINASRRLYENGAPRFEETWLDEGLAHIAEELSFYHASGLMPRRNLTFSTNDLNAADEASFNRYQAPNLGRLFEYYADPDGNSPIQGTTSQPDDDLATRGAAWQFLRYAADQRGGSERDLWFALANSTTTGISNVAAVFGTDPMTLFQNWGVAIYTDDAVTGVPPVYTHPSWNYRQILTVFGGGRFPLEVLTLANNVTRTVDLAATGNAYLRLGVLPSARAELRTTGLGVGGATCTVAPLTAVGQVYQPASNIAGAICLDGGSTGAEYTVIPFFASNTNNERAIATVRATGIVPPVSGPNPSLAAEGPTLARAAAAHAAERDGGFETRLRQRERQMLRGGIGASRNVSAAAVPEVRISIVRTK